MIEEIFFLAGRIALPLVIFLVWIVWMWVSWYHQGKLLWMWELTNWGAIGFGIFAVLGLIAAIFYVPKQLEPLPYITFVIDHAFYWAWGGLAIVGGFNLWLTLTGRKK